jgi:hypothetical protein
MNEMAGVGRVIGARAGASEVRNALFDRMQFVGAVSTAGATQPP